MTGVQTCALPICFPVTIPRSAFALLIPPAAFNQYMFDTYQMVPKPSSVDAQTAEGKINRSVPKIVRKREGGLKTQAYEQQNRDVEQKIATHFCKVGAAVVHDGVETDLKTFGTADCWICLFKPVVVPGRQIRRA